MTNVTVETEVGRDCCSEKTGMSCLLAAIESEPSCRCERQQPYLKKLCLDLIYNSSVLFQAVGGHPVVDIYDVPLKPNYTTADVRMTM